MKSTYCEYILEKILSTSEVGPILALIAPSPLLEIKHTTDPERSALWGLIFDNLLTSIYQLYICLFEPRGVLETTL